MERLIHQIELLTKTNEILLQNITSGGSGGGRSEKDKEAPGKGWKPSPCNEYGYFWLHGLN